MTKAIIELRGSSLCRTEPLIESAVTFVFLSGFYRLKSR
jgi:hypothetical protein